MFRYAIALAVLLATGSVSAGPRDDAIKYYVLSLSEKRYEEAAKVVRAQDLADFARNFAILFEAESKAGKRDLLSAVFDPAAKLEVALQATPIEMFAKTMRFVTDLSSQSGSVAQVLPPEILGEVVEKPELIHVLVRSSVRFGPIRSSKLEVFSMVPEGDQWKMVLPEATRTMGLALRRQLGL